MGEHTFLWTGRDPQGTYRNIRLDADSAQAARVSLTADGWTELQLVTDEIVAATGTAIDPPEWISEEKEAMQRTADELWTGKPLSLLLLRIWWEALRESWFKLLLFGAILAWGTHTGRNSFITFGAGGIALLVFLIPLLHSFFSLSLKSYSRLNKAKAWGRWDEVLDCVERLRRSHKLTRIGAGETELSRCKAQALAGLGRLEEAIAGFKALEGAPHLPHWLYLSHLAGIYDIARADEESLACRRQAVTEKPDSSALWIDLSYSFVRRLNRPGEARDALAKAEALEITGMGKNYLFFMRGLIFWRENNFPEARNQLMEAVTHLEQQRPTNEIVEGVILLCKSHLCAVEGALGNRTAVAKLYPEVAKYLVSTKEKELIEACRKHLPAA